MTAPLLALALVVALSWVAVDRLRNRRRRIAEDDHRLRQALQDQGGDDLVLEALDFARADGSARLSCGRLRALVDRGASVETVAAAAADALRQPLRPLPGPLSLKIHGPRITLHLVRPLALELSAREPRLARTPLPYLELAATYRVDGRADQCVTEEHLREQGVDTRDLHGIALAVLRQGFDESIVSAVLAGATRILRGPDVPSAAALLVISDFLPVGAELSATLDADHLALRPIEAGSGEDAPAPGLRLVIDARGWRIL